MNTTQPPSARASRHTAGIHSVLTLVMAVAIVCMVNYVGFKYYKQIDLSKSQFYSLSPKTKDILAKLDSPVRITTIIAPKYEEQIDNLLEQYQQAGGKNIVIEKVDLDHASIRIAELQQRLHFEATDFIIIFEYKDRSHFLKESDLFEADPMTGQVASFKGEQQFTSSIVSLTEGHAAKVYFTEGHGEHRLEDMDQQGYGALATTLKEDNIDGETVDLARTGAVPKDADALVIAGPLTAFSPIEADTLQKYLAAHGKLIVLIDPYVHAGLDDLFKNYGLKFDDDLVLYHGNTAQGQVVTIPLALIYQGGFAPNNPITATFIQNNLQIQIIGARSVGILPGADGQPNPKVQFLLQTDADAWGWVNKTAAANADDFSSYQNRTFDKTTDIPGPVTISAVYDEGTVADPGAKGSVTGARVIAVGSSKFLENDIVMAQGVADTVGSNFFTNCLDWLTKKDATLDIAPKVPQDYGIALSPMSGRTLFWVCVIFIPASALALGIFTWFSRRQ
ncbi:MAG TPA: GldG family protein [Candidatus Methylacidiphilales bacterium]|nr:GldG family protein [Candidatus Methylacidiphilales bacterium]